MRFVKALWRGEIPLWKTYWLFGFCVNLPLSVVRRYLHPNILGLSRLEGGTGFYWTIWSISVAWFLFIFVPVWRSAGNYTGAKSWSVLARTAASIGMLFLILEGVTQALSVISEDTLQETVSTFNPQLPKLFGDNRLDYLSASGMTFTYHYTAMRRRGALDSDRASFALSSDAIRSKGCKGNHRFIDAGVTVSLEYSGIDGIKFGAVVLDRETCAAYKH